MILQALCQYYERKAAADAQSIAPPGFEWKQIPLVFEIDLNGSLVQIEDTREHVGKKAIGRRFLVPQGPKKASNIAASLLWGNAEYALGVADPEKDAAEDETRQKRYRLRLIEMHDAFLARVLGLPEAVQADPGVAAVMKFLKTLDRRALEGVRNWDQVASTNPLVSFRLQGDLDLVCQRQAVREIPAQSRPESPNTFCAITGTLDESARLHPPVKGVWKAQTSGANIVSFNLSAFNSYGKTQGANAPVGKLAAFSYTTALNQLLERDSPQRLQIGDASTVFWSERETAMETAIVEIFDEPAKDDPDRNIRAVRALYEAPRTGMYNDDGASRFFVLGLAPNAARLAVRFWHVSTVAELATHIRRHFDDLEIIRPEFERQYFSLFRLLVSTAVLGRAEKIAPHLAGEVMRSVLQGSPYPYSLLQAVVLRIRAEQAAKDSRGKTAQNVSYVRAAVIKACINRAGRVAGSNEKELTVALDQDNFNAGYRLGRLFAVLEKIQDEASPGINATIRDRFYGAASSTPVAVFSNLMKLKNHHLAKIEKRGLVVYFEKLIGEIMGGISDFPAHLSLSDQGRFAIGYYHQRQAFFEKRADAVS
jgi:CRISPR-associated protein Csd1